MLQASERGERSECDVAADFGGLCKRNARLGRQSSDLIDLLRALNRFPSIRRRRDDQQQVSMKTPTALSSPAYLHCRDATAGDARSGRRWSTSRKPSRCALRMTTTTGRSSSRSARYRSLRREDASSPHSCAQGREGSPAVGAPGWTQDHRATASGPSDEAWHPPSHHGGHRPDGR